MKNFLIPLLIALTAPAFAAPAPTTISTDVVKIRKPGSSLDKVIELGSSKIKRDAATSKLQFAHDGSNFKNLGSGAGGGSGINLAQDNNVDFEIAPSGTPANHTASGGSWTQATSGANLIAGGGSGVFDASASGQTVTSDAITVTTSTIARLGGANGYLGCLFKSSAIDYLLEVYDGTNVLASRVIPALTAPQEIGLAFPIPTSGTVAYRFKSQSDAAALAVDNCTIGSSNIVSLSQASFVGGIYYAGASGCEWTTGDTTNVMTAFPADTDCPTPVMSGNATAPGTKIPAAVFPSLAEGDYLVIASGVNTAQTGAVNADLYFTLSDGSTTSGTIYVNANSTTGVAHANQIIGRFSYSASQSAKTFQVLASSSTNSNDPYIVNSNSKNEYTIRVYRYPTTQEQAFRPDQVAWYVDANISGANFNLGASNQSSYIGLENGSATLTQNSGSIAVQIPCSSTNPPTGTTCAAGNESLGVSFTVPAAGSALACASFSHDITTSASGSVNATFQIIETGNATQTIVQEGKSRVSSGLLNASSTARIPHRLCGVFNFSSAGQKTLRLMYEQVIAATVAGNQVVGDADATVGQRDIHWEVYPISQAIPAPLLVGSVTSASLGLMRTESARITCGNASSAVQASNAWISVANGVSAGQCTVTIASGIFNGYTGGNGISCTATVLGSEGGGTFDAVKTSANWPASGSISTTRWANGANANGNYDLICMGPR